MKAGTTSKTRMAKAAILPLFALSLQDAQAGAFTVLDAAWKEAVVLAGVAEASVAQPAVVYVQQEVARAGELAAEYVPDFHQIRLYTASGRAPHYLIVQGFLNSIYSQIRSTASEPGAVAQADSRETWVRGKMAWRVNSPTFKGSAALN